MPYLFFFLLILSAANWSLETTVSQEGAMPSLTIMSTTTAITADTSRPAGPDNNLPQEEEAVTIFITEELPRFPGCEEMEGDHVAKKACADQKMLHYIYSQLQYPKEAREKGVEGIVVVSFVVTPVGKMEDIQVLRDIGAGTAKEAKRIVKSMNELEPWIPGKSLTGKPVAVKLNLPIRFKLN